MVNKGLAYYLKHPEKISELTPLEMDRWVKEFPYSQSVRWLKARYDLESHSVNLSKSLRRAAIYTPDLVFLRHQMLFDSSLAEGIKDQLVALRKEEEVESSKVTKVKESSLPDQVEHTSTTEASPTMPPDNTESLESEKKEQEAAKPKREIDKKPSKTSAKKKSGKEKSDKALKTKKKSKLKDQKEEVKDELEAALVRARTRAKKVDEWLQSYEAELSSFSQWLLEQNATSKEAETPKEKKSETSARPSKKKKSKKKKSKKKKSKLDKLIEHSIVEKEDVLSETYADLLASQGYTQKAAELYERLRLIFPEKSSYFARKIEELQK